MQASYQFRARLILSAAAVFFCAAPVEYLRAAGASAPKLSEARLLAASKPADGVWHAGIAVDLTPGTMTYWRNPGEAGIPPTFDFSKSTNVERVDVAFPTPIRIHEGDIDAAGYEKSVTFPIRVTPKNAGQPVGLALSLDYATCSNICLPAHADLSLPLPAPADATDDSKVASAESSVPRVLNAADAASAAQIRVEKSNGGPPSWRVVPSAEFHAREIFVEPPEGYFLTTKRDDDGSFLLTLSDHPADRLALSGPLRVTLASADKAVEFETRLPE